MRFGLPTRTRLHDLFPTTVLEVEVVLGPQPYETPLCIPAIH